MSNDLRNRLYAPDSSVGCSRREMLSRCGLGIGMLGLTSLLVDDGALATDTLPVSDESPLGPKATHFPARAKRVIWFFINGGPSQVDTWDYKPALDRLDGMTLDGFDNTTGFFPDQVGALMKSPFKFQRHGESGKWVSEIFPQLSRHVDKMAFIHSGYTESNNHSPALFMMNSGARRMGFPCVGSWVTYGLGTENQNLPAFVVMSDPLGRGLPKGHTQNWGSGFLPGIYQGTHLRPTGEPIENLYRPAGVTDPRQRAMLDLIGQLGKHHLEQHPAEKELAARIDSFELAYRMQSAAPEAIDIASEPQHIRDLYGVEDERCKHVAAQCLTARRMLERGVRFIQIYSGGMENQLSWDGHVDIHGNHAQFAGETDKPIAALLTDLEQRGLLDDTLVIWGGEFGRGAVAQKGEKPGRDHNPNANTFWMAGGGIRGGVSYGETDETGNEAAVNRVSVHDLHATILHLLGVDHEKLIYRYSGRDFRLTDVAGNVVHDIVT